MTAKFRTTRRAALIGITSLFGGALALRPSDVELLKLGATFDDIAERVDFALQHSGPGHSYYTEMLTTALNDFEIIRERIGAIRAKTMGGLKVKARVAKWASSGAMYPEDTAILVDPIALSLADDVLKAGS
jgi:hypothetical protein